MRVLLDTSVIVPALRGQQTLWERLQEVEVAYLCVPVLAELLTGALRSSNPSEAVAAVRQFASYFPPVLPCDEETAVHYAEIESHLRRQGTPVPVNDLWIAAIARQHRLLLATRDTHYERIPELQVEVW
ncbi:MAG: type II toxin-antitoxin system VapC family toxin [Fimbriimonadales bacterium]|nr:type II toxin-antitoxin system VapC family toxin [Fimbriimonadales bacterium]